ncbi:hypothetical protein MRBLWH7_002392 [Microbacterium sp. LWH7-1.2]|uniref:hypothetical protein n=1 Tax=Microbacterium sp. LWH7-1.2 TaxID=3135257 RepID=UPI0031391A94
MNAEFWSAVVGTIPVIALAVVIESRIGFERDPDRRPARLAGWFAGALLVIGEGTALTAMICPWLAHEVWARVGTIVVVCVGLGLAVIPALTGMVQGSSAGKS